MRGALLLASWMLTGAATQAADEIEPLDADFLDYLANLEADDDNWTLLEEATDREPLGRDPQAEKPVARKATKEAAKPAVEER